MEPKQPPPSGEDPGKLKLLEVGQEITVPPKTRIVSQGEAPQAFYVIQSGKVKVFRETADGIRTELTELGMGDYFGEVALVTGKPRTASVETVEETRLIEISKEEFDQVLDHNPQLARHIIRQLASWLVDGDQRLESEVVHQVKLRQISWFDYVLMVGLSIVFAIVFNLYNDNQIPLFYHPGGKDAVGEITLSQALELYRKNEAVFVDARKNSFFEQRHIKDALSLPVIFFDLMYPMFEFMAAQKGGAKDKPVIVYGGTPSRRFDLELARLLNKKGYEKVMVLAGDYQAWQNTFPLGEKPAKAPAALPLGLAGFIEWLPLSIFVLMLVPPIRRSPYLSVICRVLLGWIFIQFALSKIMRPAVFALNVVDYGMMPAWGVNLWALVLPWAELVVGLFLVLGIRTRAAATLIGAMNIIFIVGLVNAIHHNLPINCGCVGEAGEPVNWWKVTKNAGMLLMAIQIFLYDRIFVLDRGGFVWRERRI
ncbi:MAG: cyclic nucleotide-binding domain-containing protein [Deltaproteobacteria bacterium]|nr:cyclic nucleotide-binding domain-containing protein [Deltaproteobacteria bacterium]